MPRIRKIKFLRQCEKYCFKNLKSMSVDLNNQVAALRKEKSKMEDDLQVEDSDENSVSDSSGSSDFVLGGEEDDIFA